MYNLFICFMKSGHPTIKDIAKKLKTSPSTVSRALRDHPDINSKTKKRMQALAQRMDYHPKSIAKILKKRKTQKIGACVPDISHDFFATIISSIEDIAYNNRYIIMVCQPHESAKKEYLNIKTMILNRVNGLMISILQNTKNKEPPLSLNRQKLPFIFFRSYTK